MAERKSCLNCSKCKSALNVWTGRRKHWCPILGMSVNRRMHCEAWEKRQTATSPEWGKEHIVKH